MHHVCHVIWLLYCYFYLDEVSDKCRIGSDPNLAVASFDKTVYDIAKECLN